MVTVDILLTASGSSQSGGFISRAEKLADIPFDSAVPCCGFSGEFWFEFGAELEAWTNDYNIYKVKIDIRYKHILIIIIYIYIEYQQNYEI